MTQLNRNQKQIECCCPNYNCLSLEDLIKIGYLEEGDDISYFRGGLSCCGEWTKGSGGHRQHEGKCDKNVIWWHPDDSYQYCAEHCPEIDKEYYNKEWLKIYAKNSSKSKLEV